MISMDFPTKQRILPLDTSIGSKRGQNRPPRENEPRQYVGTSLQRVEMRLRSLQVGGFDAISDRTPAAEVCVPRGSGLILLQARGLRMFVAPMTGHLAGAPSSACCLGINGRFAPEPDLPSESGFVKGFG